MGAPGRLSFNSPAAKRRLLPRSTGAQTEHGLCSRSRYEGLGLVDRSQLRRVRSRETYVVDQSASHYRQPGMMEVDTPVSLLADGKLMNETTSKRGPVHKIPTDMRTALTSRVGARTAWKGLTPLMRNEWICWITSPKQEVTRGRRIERAMQELLAGKRRPCCWPGCPHRRPSARKWFERRVS